MANGTFHDAVEAIPELASSYRPGLQALKGADRRRIDCSSPRRLRGSVYLEGAIGNPNTPAWDYGIGYCASQNDEAIWVEVHPANSHHVSEVIRKACWLKGWLQGNAVELLNMTRAHAGYVWLATGRISLQRHSRQALALAAAGVSFPESKLRLS